MTCPTTVMFDPLPAAWNMPLTITIVPDVANPATLDTAGMFILRGQGFPPTQLVLKGAPSLTTATVALPAQIGSPPYSIDVPVSAGVPVQKQTCNYGLAIAGDVTTSNGLTDLAHEITIALSPTIPKVGQPVRASLVLPMLPDVIWVDPSGNPITTIRFPNPQTAWLRVLQAELFAAALGPRRHGDLPDELAVMARRRPLLQREFTAQMALAALSARERFELRPNLVPVPAVSIQVDVTWRIGGFGIVGDAGVSANVAPDTLFRLVDPNDPAGAPAPTLNSPTIGLLFRPFVIPATHPPTPLSAGVTAAFFIYADIILTNTALGAKSDKVTLSLPLPVPTLELPTLAVLFVDINFHGPTLICLPANGRIDGVTGKPTLDDVKHVLETVRDSLAGIQSLVGVAEWLAGLNTLLSSLPANVQGDATCISDSNGKVDLEKPTLWREPPGVQNYDWADQASSAICVGAPNQTVQFATSYDFGDTSHPYWDYGGVFNVFLDWNLNVRLPDFTQNPPKAVAPIGGVVDGMVGVVQSGGDYNDAVTSVTFM